MVVTPQGAGLVSRHSDVEMIRIEWKTNLLYLTTLDIRRNISRRTPNLV